MSTESPDTETEAAAAAAPAGGGGAKPPVLAVLLIVPALLALALWAFAWPAARTAPRDLPLGVAGPAAATAPLKAQLSKDKGAFEMHSYPTEAAARKAIKEREVYGAFVVTPQGPRLLTASGASTVVAQLLQQGGERALAGGKHGPPLKLDVQDVVPNPAGDPRGAALSASVLPLAIVGGAGGILVFFAKRRALGTTVLLLGVSAAAGAVVAAVAQSWLGALQGNWWADAGAAALLVLALSATVAGLARVLGTAGLGLGMFLMIFIGNPFSGMASAPELLPEPVGLIGQWLPPGAGGQLIRSVSSFDGNAIGTPVAVLSAWAAAGLLLVWLGRARARG
jgi:hypothetical protein